MDQGITCVELLLMFPVDGNLLLAVRDKGVFFFLRGLPYIPPAASIDMFYPPHLAAFLSTVSGLVLS